MTKGQRKEKVNVDVKRVILTVAWGGILSLMAWASDSWAQSATLQTAQRPPYYVGVPLELQVVAEGFTEKPQPKLEFEQPKGASLNLTGVSPNVSSSIQIINGRMTQSRSVVFNYHLRFLAPKVGRYQVGPLLVVQGNSQKKIAAVSIDVTDVPTATNQRVRLLIPNKNLYVGQRIPIRLEWWVEADGVENLMNQQASVPLFDRQEDFQFHDQEKETENTFSILLNSGQKVFPATVRSDQVQGKSYVVWRVERVMIPLKAGDFDIQPASVNVDEGLRWQRDLFGRRTVTQSRKLRANSQVVRFKVLPLPTKNRPPSFAGAVGKGFVLEVSADRSVVQVGDPITLTLSLKGDAEVANASLPSMTTDLPNTDFRLPNGKIAGEYVDGEKRFEMVIRVLNDAVREIPPIAYSWFDPELKVFQTTLSRPIALSVKGAQMISAQDVVRANPVTATPAPVSTDREAPSTYKQKRNTYTLSGADLSINRDVRLLTRSSGSFLGSWWQQGLSYGLAVMLMFIAALIRRQADVDPETTEKFKELKLQRDIISNTANVEDLSDALRRMASVTQVISRQEYESLLAECDALQYAPDSVDADRRPNPLSGNLRNRGLSLADEMLEVDK
ncbi:MAG: BatD family protein [Candidatus Poribacteria bacterium]|nr:BatD family protein [Candidatus Poribacteria bacterium]MDP6749009.1 BatD family protein [Candidatus Poribacteria bacterium]MDP6997975.1 BatD family protein [Candidatus Poribacteria bacterium]